MKKIIYLAVAFFVYHSAFSQENLRDGIYVVDQSPTNKRLNVNERKVAVNFNRFFINEESGDYPPVIVHTDDFVPLELADIPVIQRYRNEADQLIVQLTTDASDKLKEFTSRNMMNYIAVVVNTEVLVIYKVVQPVAGTFIKITNCDGQGCDQVYYRLRRSIRLNRTGAE